MPITVAEPKKADAIDTQTKDHAAFASTNKRTDRALWRALEAMENEYAA